MNDEIDRLQADGLEEIRAFLKERTSYDALPVSYRLIVLEVGLTIKTSLSILVQNNIVSTPLWDSRTAAFAGLLTVTDYINVIQYFRKNPAALEKIDKMKLRDLRDIERAIGVTPIETISINPMRPIYEACQLLVKTKARRIPLIDKDDESKRDILVSVVTQYRILKFIAINSVGLSKLQKPIKDLPLGTYKNLASVRMHTPVIQVVELLVAHNISSIPIIDDDDMVLNVFEAVDVIPLIKDGDFEEQLRQSAGDALLKRAEDFPGIYTCTIADNLDNIFDTLRRARVHRFVIVDETGRLAGALTLSDILRYVLTEGESDWA